MLNGVGVSKGYSIGKAVIIQDANLDYSHVKFDSVDAQLDKLHKATDEFISTTKQLSQDIKENVGETESMILQGHIAMLSDPFMIEQMEENIKSNMVAEQAVDSVCTMFYQMFSGADDDLTKQRATDVMDIKNSLLSIMLGVKSVDINSVPADSILIAKDFTPSMTSQINKNNVTAIVAQVGSYTSHSAILARSMGITAVLSVDSATTKIADNSIIIVDGFTGEIIENPTAQQISEYTQKQSEYLLKQNQLQKYINMPTVTKSGITKEVFANVGSIQDVENAIKNGCEGIGLFRTEFVFMDSLSEPTQDKQFEIYSKAVKMLNGKTVIFRTLDIGGDKDIPYLNIEKEDNPFLGFRAIRYCLKNVDLFKNQIKAILRSGVYGDAKIMLPLVTCVDEIIKTKSIIKQCEEELKSQNIQYKSCDLGVMIETPSAAIISDLLAKEVSFFSIGTNDLTGYTMAVDRGNSKVANLYNTNQIAVLRSIEMTIKNAKSQNITVGMCGESAADEKLISQLVEWGLDEFSVSSNSILNTRKTICNCE